MNENLHLETIIKARFGDSMIIARQPAADDTLTLWINPDNYKELLRFLKLELVKPFRMLYDLTAIDERRKRHPDTYQKNDFTLVYYLTSFERNEDIRIKVPLKGDYPSATTVTDIWPSANWYEREIYDMFGITFISHPNLCRILMPKSWEGHPLRKDFPVEGPDFDKPFVPEV